MFYRWLLRFSGGAALVVCIRLVRKGGGLRGVQEILQHDFLQGRGFPVVLTPAGDSRIVRESVKVYRAILHCGCGLQAMRAVRERAVGVACIAAVDRRKAPFTVGRPGMCSAHGAHMLRRESREVDMANVQTKQAVQHNGLTELFRDKLRKVTDSGGAQDRVQRIMLALGYAMALTPTGNPGFSRVGEYKGVPVNVWVGDVGLTAWPRTLLSPVWVGYYSLEEPAEMVQYEEHERLMDYLRDRHPEAFQTPSAFGEGEG